MLKWWLHICIWMQDHISAYYCHYNYFYCYNYDCPEGSRNSRQEIHRYKLTDAETDTYADAEADTDTDTNTDADSEIHTRTHTHARAMVCR